MKASTARGHEPGSVCSDNDNDNGEDAGRVGVLAGEADG
jgi:hypothetical protein